MLEFVEKLPVKTLTLALILAAGLCWPVLCVVQIDPRNTEIRKLEKENAELKGEVKAISTIRKNEIAPYEERVRLLIEENTTLKGQNVLLTKHLDKYQGSYSKLENPLCQASCPR